MLVAVALAALGVTPGSLALNPAQQQTIAIAGAVPPVTVSAEHRLVMVSVNAAGTTATVTATQATGSDVLHVVDALGGTADVPVRVAFNAGTVAPQISLTVTGDPIDPAWLSDQMQAAVARATQAMPGALMMIATPAPPALVPGAAATVAVPVQISGNGSYFDIGGTTNVTVRELPLVHADPALLFYDDDPEDVTQDGVLYRGTVTVAQPVRLYTYHDNAGTADRSITVVLSALATSRVQAIDALAGPNVDVMSVGHAVGVTYLTVAPKDEGIVLTLPAAAPYVLHGVTAGYGELVAEALDLRVLSGGPVTVTVLGLAPGQAVQTFLDQATVPGDGHGRTGVFAIAGYGDAMSTYVAGGPDARVTYGARDPSPPAAVPGQRGHDYGGYGVLYHFVFTLTNPTGAESNAYLYERPLSGDVRSSFLVDGTLVQLGCARESVPYQIEAYGLQPYSTYRVVVETMPDGGSSYPMELGVTATPPIPQTPPLDAPNGCFPRP